MQKLDRARGNMSQPRNGKIIEELDRAFRFALILINILFGVLAQYSSVEKPENLPPIIANVQKLSIVFVFPTILTIVAWISSYFVVDENWKMRLRTYSWSSMFFLVFLELVEFYLVCIGENRSNLALIPFAVLIVGGLLFPIVPFWLLRKVLRRYEMSLKDIGFFAEGGRSDVGRYAPFVVSWVVFWSAFSIA